ncbi:MAG: hypothetical protein ACYCQK_02075 [Acidiferrobacteraceae bacterium]
MAWAILVLAVILLVGGLVIIDRRGPGSRLRLRWSLRGTLRQIRRLPVYRGPRRWRERA